ncbi:MAG: glycosyltransferase family 39 protein [Phycisphaerales bacterium]|nr:MAG: glycosyltransferase family 39 protein [Phycisphaerales bacterium]
MAPLNSKNPLVSAAMIPAVVAVLCLAPFVDKAVHLDDPVFIWSAKHIHSKPFDFYGFKANWYATELGMWEMHHNPPGACYYMALAALVLGWSEVALHTAFLVPAVAAALGTYYLAKVLHLERKWAVLAAVAAVVTPGFVVSGTTLMCDMLVLALWVWAVALWAEGMKEDKQLRLFFAAILISLCMLTRYIGIALVMLLFAYSLMHKRKLGMWVLYLAIPAVVLGAYMWAACSLYGRGILSQAASFAVDLRWKEKAALFSKAVSGLAFAGGCIITVLFYAPLLWSRRVLIVSVVLIILFTLMLASAEKIGNSTVRDSDGVRWVFLVQVALMAAAGASLIGLASTDFRQHRDADSLLLALWVVGILVFASLINWTVNARSILPMVPAAGIMLMRRVESRPGVKHKARMWRAAWPLVPTAVVALSVGWADYAWANTARSAAETISKSSENHKGTIWFQGHWGFQYYMESSGHKALDTKHSRLSSGDIVIVPSNNCFTWNLPRKRYLLSKTFEIGPSRRLSTMNLSVGAGFYSDIWGPLPFAVGLVAAEKYQAFIVR